METILDSINFTNLHRFVLILRKRYAIYNTGIQRYSIYNTAIQRLMAKTLPFGILIRYLRKLNKEADSLMQIRDGNCRKRKTKYYNVQGIIM